LWGVGHALEVVRPIGNGIVSIRGANAFRMLIEVLKERVDEFEAAGNWHG
jgi:hypothetical protein